MSGKASVVDIVTDHFETLRDDRTSQLRIRDFVGQVGIPVAIGVAAPLLGFRLVEAGQLIAGLAVLAGFTFGLLIFVFQLRMQVTTDPRVQNDGDVRELIDQLFQNVAYAALAGFVAVLAAVVCVSVTWESNPLPVRLTTGIETAVLVTLTLHYVMTMAMCAKRVTSAYHLATR